MARRSKRGSEFSFLKELAGFFVFMVKLPYYFVSWIIYEANRGIDLLVKGHNRLVSKNEEKGLSAKFHAKTRRASDAAKYSSFKILQVKNGDFKKWEGKITKSDSSIGIILGARGSGKTALGVKLLENLYSRNKKKCYAMGFNEEEMPSWIDVVEQVNEIGNDSFVLIDEGGVLFSSRRAMSSPNKLLGDLILVARHKNISIIFISQNSSNLDVNIIRQADYIMLKPSSLLQKDFERKKVKEIYSETEKDFKKFREEKGSTYLYSDEFRGFVSNPLPSFWNERVSKSFK